MDIRQAVNHKSMYERNITCKSAKKVKEKRKGRECSGSRRTDPSSSSYPNLPLYGENESQTYPAHEHGDGCSFIFLRRLSSRRPRRCKATQTRSYAPAPLQEKGTAKEPKLESDLGSCTAPPFRPQPHLRSRHLSSPIRTTAVPAASSSSRCRSRSCRCFAAAFSGSRLRERK